MAADFDYSSLTADDIEFVQPPELEAEEIPESDPDYPDTRITQERTRTARAKKYDKKAAVVIGAMTRATLENPHTVTDGVTLLYYGQTLVERVGDLADADDRVRRALDSLENGVNNPYIAAISTAAIVGLQIARNHESAMQTEVKALRIPFTKKTFKFKVRLRFPERLRPFTHDPDELTRAALTPSVLATLKRQGVKIAPRYGNRDNGARRGSAS